MENLFTKLSDEAQVEKLDDTQVAEIIEWGKQYLPWNMIRALSLSMDKIAEKAELENEFDNLALSLVPNLIQEARDGGLYQSPRLRPGIYDQLDMQTELKEYVEQWQKLRRENTELFVGDFGELDVTELEAVVIIPIGASQEKQTLRKTLDQYARQTADPKKWALALFVNDASGEMRTDDIHAMLAQIEEFTHEYPELQVLATSTCYGEPVPIGTIRADIWDSVAYKLYTEHAPKDIIGISHDADASWISTTYIDRMCEDAKANPEKDMFSCKLRWDNVGGPQTDMNKVLRYWEFVGSAERIRNGFVGGSDANTAIRMSSYVAIGGFWPGDCVAEMIGVRRSLSTARTGVGILKGYGLNHYKQSVHFVQGIGLKTNPRRVYQAMLNGHPPDYSWSNLSFLTGDDPVRALNVEELATQPLGAKKLLAILRGTDNANLANIDELTSERLRTLGRKIIGLPAPISQVRAQPRLSK